jgi:hypothetical protein
MILNLQPEMKNYFLLLAVLISLSRAGIAQEMKSWNGRFGKLDYIEYQSSGSPEKLLIVDSKNGELTALLSNSLIPITNELRAKFVLLDLSRFDSKLISDAFEKGVWENLSCSSTTFISMNDNVETSLVFMEYYNRFIYLNPLVDSTINNLVFSDEILISIISELSAEELSITTNELIQKNIWVNSQNVEHTSPFPAEAIKSSLLWMDSLSVILEDSLANAQLSKSAGVKKTIPEVLRQGKSIEVEIQVYEAGYCVIEILDLSTDVVFTKNELLGKGTHLIKIPTKDLDWGVYNLEIKGTGFETVHKFMIRG